MGRRRERPRGRGIASIRLTCGVLLLLLLLVVVVVIGVVVALVVSGDSREWSVMRSDPGGSPFLVGCAFLIFPSGNHSMEA